MAETQGRVRYRSLFWPVLLISVGLIALLGQAGILSAANIVSVLRLWPLLLIVIGLDLLFGRTSPLLGALIGVGAVVLIFVLMLIGPSIGLGGDWELREFTGSELLSGAESARVELDLSAGTATVKAVDDPDNLIEADLKYMGNEVTLEVTGEQDRTVTLRQESDPWDLFGIVGALINDEDQYWNIGLSDRVPLELTINFNAGAAVFDLRDLQLEDLRLTVNAGTGEVTLPAMETRYRATITKNAGTVDIMIPGGADIDLDITSNAGSTNIEVPRDAAVRLDANINAGSLSVPSRFSQIRRDDRVAGESGTWETPDFDDAEQRITINYEGNAGSLTVR